MYSSKFLARDFSCAGVSEIPVKINKELVMVFLIYILSS